MNNQLRLPFYGSIKCMVLWLFQFYGDVYFTELCNIIIISMYLFVCVLPRQRRSNKVLLLLLFYYYSIITL